MSGLAKVILNAGKEQSPKRFHPWIFSGAINRIEGTVQDGDVVEVYTNKGEYVCTGHIQNGSIAVRIFSFQQVVPDELFWKEKIEKAYNYRKAIGLIGNKDTNAYRLVYGEGDGMPGLVIDYYNGSAVIQAHSVGMHAEKEKIVSALKAIYGEELKSVYDKSKESLGDKYNEGVENGYLFGEDNVKQVLENGNTIKVDWEEGQKTGFFLDQRENRKLVGQYAKGKKVLDCFCYAGGFSLYALKGGANEVHSVDSSKTAIKLTDDNIALNFGSGAKQTSHVADAFDFLKDNQGQYDIMVVDPPAFAKHRDARHQAVMGYKRLNALAIQGIKPGGLIFTFSCSQVVDKPLFYGAITAAAIETGRTVRILQYLSQPADHPISIYHPEGEYLKGMLLFVE
ncbi:MAG TPA: class I SAM-dependent rRNA methyltransferase [Bacteroidia bacterium]|jgi:23S rRNA (cytosine1962-C5)-methyltransferase|nr:class I SAM-dependent rRNA methyltransferase [Bacteroidia bacterium]